jgi:hypothetical protein
MTPSEPTSNLSATKLSILLNSHIMNVEGSITLLLMSSPVVLRSLVAQKLKSLGQEVELELSKGCTEETFRTLLPSGKYLWLQWSDEVEQREGRLSLHQLQRERLSIIGQDCQEQREISNAYSVARDFNNIATPGPAYRALRDVFQDSTPGTAIPYDRLLF